MTDQQIQETQDNITELMQEKIDLKQQIDLIEKEIMDNLFFLISIK